MRILKKTLKITAIVLLSLVVLVATVAGIATYVVFTPERLTPIVVKQANSFVNARVNIESVELTFFSTFPNFGLRVNNCSVVNEQLLSSAQSAERSCFGGRQDSLLTLGSCVLIVDVKEFLDNKKVVVHNVELNDVNMFAYVDADGKANFDIVKPDTAQVVATDTAGSDFELNASLRKLSISNSNIFYQDKKQGISSCLRGLNLNVDGAYANNVINGNVLMDVAQLSLAMNDTTLADKLALKLSSSLKFDQNASHVELQKAQLQVNDITLSTNGSVQTDTAFSQFDMDLQLAMQIPSLSNLMALVPVSMVPEAAQAKVHGAVEFSGSAKGLFKDSTSMPVVSGDLTLKNIGGSYQSVPYRLDKLNSTLSLLVDFAHQEKSFVDIKKLDVEVLDSKLSVTGSVRDVMRDPLLNLAIKASTDLAKVSKHVPLDTGMSVEGLLKADVKTNMRLSEATGNGYEKLKVNGTVDITGLKYSSARDTLSATLGDVAFAFETNAKNAAAKGGKDFLAGTLSVNTLRAQVGKDMRANVRKASLAFTTGNVMDTTRLPTVHCTFDLGGNSLRTDSMRVSLRRLHGVADITPTKTNKMLPHVEASFELDSLRARVANNMVRLASGKNTIVAEQSSDTTVGFQGWKAKVDLDYKQMQAFTPSFPEMVYVDKLVAQITDERQDLQQCDIRIGNSDMHLTGTVEDALAYLDKKATVKTNIKLAANNLDLNQLMRISEAGSTVEVSGNLDVENPEHIEAIKRSAKVDTTPPSIKAVILPTDVYARFETDIKHATFSRMELENIKGSVSLADGALMLQELGVIANKKSRMKVTAIYRTPELNHVYAGLEYHLMGVELGELQNIIPEVDSVLPMLRSFEGKVDFHIAAQTYLDSLLNVKFSTLRGVSSIHGENLVLMDNETFSEISKLMRFKNQKRNVIDSLSVEVIVFKKQVELYPFLLSIDRYKVALGGQHKLNMEVNYHASILESPLPMRLGVDIKGNMNDIQANPVKYVHLVKPKYAETFIPQKHGVNKSAEEEIRDQIRAALRKAAEE